MDRLPTLFVSHGAPTLALERPDARGDHGDLPVRLAALGRGLARPAAVLVASAHWETAAPAVGGAASPATIHDFVGFGPELERLRYPAPGAPEVARRASALLGAAGLPARIDADRGLDHGVWVLLRHLYPDAGVPVLPLALQPQLGPVHHLRLGAALAPLREEGVLIVGSGGLTHDLRAAFAAARGAPSGAPKDRSATAFADWIAGRLAAGDVAGLLDYRRLAPDAARHHPTEEHLLPLFVALGAAGDGGGARRLSTGTLWGALSLDAYRFDGPPRPGGTPPMPQ